MSQSYLPPQHQLRRSCLPASGSRGLHPHRKPHNDNLRPDLHNDLPKRRRPPESQHRGPHAENPRHVPQDIGVHNLGPYILEQALR